MWEQIGRDDKALEDYDAAPGLQPRFIIAYDRRGLILERDGQREAAVAEWSQALKIDPFHPKILRHRGNALWALGRFDAATADFEAALVHGSQEPYVQYNFGSLLLYKIKDSDRAVRHLEKATALSPGNAAFWYHLGVAHYHRVDCQIIPVMRHYRALCDSGNAQAKDCTDDKYGWAKGTEIFVEDGECPDRGD